ncbi:DHA2 family efflux MFS transporter permease subunit [Alicyclobacillus cycloheptanicus]|uniref:EmrB/QacA subfamily drug resistance transporter n=1 Tax=Alicyclobacillus cycloheptanicus TaxID=1457 RepID=A0ABT9XFW6_9BACL|nr:DHA2 family efflux MFS transporter permease subunit [Alicyclobacillus cycloheptanicus]MDQ0189192.1 EmrB/QacA subfamily drug resistance transporter [Alicyclobacillus cycloheptanicus]
MTSLGVLLVMVNLGALNVALPAIARHFHTGAALSNWILLSYMVVNTVLILVFGQFSDAFGRKMLYLLGMAAFTVMSFVVGFAQNIWLFILFRALQAAGGALIITNNTALITDAFPEAKLSSGLAANVLISSVAQLVGPVVGGVIASTLGWQWVFWSTVPIGVVGVVWGWFTLRHLPSQGSGRRIDTLGGAVTFVALSALIIALSEGSSLGWTAPLVLGGLVLFALLVPLLIWVEQRTHTPMFDFSLFANRAYAMANVATFLNSFARVSVVLLVSLYLQSLLHVDAFFAGISVLPVTVGMIVAAPLTGPLANRFSARILSTTGLGISAVGLILLMGGLRVHLSASLNDSGMFLVGFGSGLFMTPNTRSIMTGVPPERRGFANGLRSMLQNMGQVLSTAVSMTIITSILPLRLQNVVYTGTSGTLPAKDMALIDTGYRLAFLALLAATLAGMAASSLRGESGSPTHPGG